MVNGNKELLTQLIINILNYVGSQSELGKSIYEQLAPSVKDLLKSIDSDDFNNIFKALFANKNGVEAIVRNLVSSVADNIDIYQSANNLVDILKVYISDETKVEELTQNFKVILDSILTNDGFKKLLNGL
ncbi:UNVERIFIED_CONTAM: hypothetical protein O8I53_08055 [Campylobacter lari]